MVDTESIATTQKTSFLEGEFGDLRLKWDQHYDSAENTEQLKELIENIDEDVSRLDEKLTEYVRNGVTKQHSSISNIEMTRARLSSTNVTVDKMKGIFSSANDLGQILTYRVKSLDQEICNVKKTMEFVKATKLIKTNINRCGYSMEHHNWEDAANCIQNINSKVPNDIITSNYASFVVPSEEIPELPVDTLKNWISKLNQEFEKRFQEAVRRKEVPDITKFFRLFPLIGREENGLNCYSDFISQIVNDSLRVLLTSISEDTESSKRPGIYASSCRQFFENISSMLSQHDPLIKRYYKSTYENALFYVVTRIFNEIDSQVGLISDTFYDIRRLEKILHDIRYYDYPILADVQRGLESLEHRKNNREVGDDWISTVEVNDLIDELASIMNSWMLFCKFMTLKYYLKSQERTETLRVPQIIRKSNFTQKINSKLLPAFERLYSYFYCRSLEKAIVIEELPSLNDYLTEKPTVSFPESPPCSSVIEDITLIFNTTLALTLETSQLPTVKKFIADSSKIIQEDFLGGYLAKQFRENQPRYNATLHLITARDSESKNDFSTPLERGNSQEPESAAGRISFFKGASSAWGNVVGGGSTVVSSTANHPKLLNFLLYLNTVALSEDYFAKIVKNFAGEYNLKSYFPFEDESNVVNSVLLSNFLEPLSKKNNRTLQDNIIVLYNQCFKNKLVTLIHDCLPDADESNYMIYSSSSLNDTTTMLNFSTAWQRLTRPYKQVCHKTLVFEKLLSLIVLNLANIIELRLVEILKLFRINELGSLKLEKDLSYIINEVCEDHYELRERFLRVTQITMLIGMEDDEYEQSFDAVGKEDGHDFTSGINWVLTPLERKRYRRARV